jgi:ATP-dependent Lhr-like helicase
VCWGRGSLRSSNLPLSAAPEEARNAQTSRVTPVTLALRSDLAWLLSAARGGASPGALGPETARVVECLERSGALFLSQLCALTGLTESAVREALWDGVARGVLSADGWSALRNLIGQRSPSDSYRSALLRGVGSLRRGVRGSLQADGRWSLLHTGTELHERDALCEAVAEQLVARWGVVFYDLVSCEDLALPWREILWALRRLEARGQLRGGHFVTGFVGEQYALPETIAQLRAIRREPKRGQTVRLSACDPLNLTGVLFRSPRVAALRSNYVTYFDGAPQERALAAPAV